MSYRNFFVKIIRFGLVACNLFINNGLLAENLKNCPKDYSPPLLEIDKNQGIIINVRKGVVDANNNDSLREHLELLKLNAVEEFSKVIKTEITSTPTEYGGRIYKKKFNTSWDFMKESIASMEEISVCVKDYKKKDVIIFSAIWTPKSTAVVQEIIKLENAWDQLKELRMEDPNFNYEDLVKKYPNIFDTDDPNIILEAIDYWKKYRRF